MKYLAVAFLIVFIFTPLVMEAIRSYVDARRVKETGIGGTGDIAMWGLLILTIEAVVTSLVLWFAFASAS